jgi:NAD(P)-dependent dehydrogenase (short-subunit alcohol dehydrogenase family)
MIGVIGASGGIGRALVSLAVSQNNVARVHAFARSDADFENPRVTSTSLDILDEDSIVAAVNALPDDTRFDIILIATGILHGADFGPEKTYKDINAETFTKVLSVNTTGPALCVKHFLPLLRRDRKSVFAAISARVGSTSDNRLGGWYAYRASKAALNMLLKSASIEMARTHKSASIIGLHPGTVDTQLSQPFQKNVPEGKLFTSEYSASKLLQVTNTVTPEGTGKVFAWNGEEIPA